MRRQTCVLTRQDTTGIGHELLQEVDVLVLQRVHRKIDLWLRPRRAGFRGAAAPSSISIGPIDIGLAWHSYLISRCKVWRRRKGLYFLSSTLSVCNFLLRVVVYREG